MPVNQYERAFRAWPILTSTAAAKGTINYADLAAKLGIHPRPIRFVLGKIQDYCLDAKLPPLTILVVSQSSHHPGTGFIAWDIDHWSDGVRQVHEFHWQDRANPFGFAADGSTPRQLAERLFKKPEDAKSIYGRIRDRGYARLSFASPCSSLTEGDARSASSLWRTFSKRPTSSGGTRRPLKSECGHVA